MAGISSTFQANETVGFLHEAGTAVIVRIEGERAIVEDENGFERSCQIQELVKMHLQKDDFERHDLNVPIVQKESKRERKNPNQVNTRKSTVPEIDLHIESLTESNSGMSNAEIMVIQLRSLDHFFNEMVNVRVRKFIIIHGVGEGTLKSEVRKFIKSKKGAYCYDADFRKYGIGATEVEIRFTEREK
jgi:dsDNA-specific endonuclease/ATPase MutS2